MPDTATAAPTDSERFFTLLQTALSDGRFVKLVLAKPKGAEVGLERLLVRQIVLREQACLSFVYRYTTRDITKNLPLPEALALLRELLGSSFRNAHLLTQGEEVQLAFGKKGTGRLSVTKTAETLPAAADTTHDREKQRWIALDSPFLTALGVTTAQHQLIPAMSRKWKQINKFIEIFAHALAASALAPVQQLRVVDFGSGKGYLTFAIHHWLREVKGLDAGVTGVELRPDMVSLCNRAIATLGLQGLRIAEGDVRSWQPGAMDVMIALHACDTATDHAIHLGVRAGAQIILCSPCCHSQLRPQLMSPHPLRPLLQHGVHHDQQAEMLTDGLRALLLEACGYDTQVFEFISLEHTSKNKMILAVKRPMARANEPVLGQIHDLKQFYGIRDQCLEALLQADGLLAA